MFRDDDELRVFQQIVSGFDTPAFLRRAKRVDDAWNVLLDKCQRQREEWLEPAKLRLAMLAALAGAWSVLVQLGVEPAEVEHLQELFGQWRPQLRVAMPPTKSPRKLRATLQQLSVSLARFNQRWEQFLHGLDLSEINHLRAGYNQYYVLEKECMVRSAKIAREGFRPLPPVTIDDLLSTFPLIRVPQTP